MIGALDDIYVYNYALGVKEVTALYENNALHHAIGPGATRTYQL